MRVALCLFARNISAEFICAHRESSTDFEDSVIRGYYKLYSQLLVNCSKAAARNLQ
jgi:hypothetical protein